MGNIKKIQKLDRRHTGYRSFGYYAIPRGNTMDSMVTLNQWREWCWQTWGPAAERDATIWFNSQQGSDYRWAWDTEHGHRRIYFKTEAELNWFMLRWSA